MMSISNLTSNITKIGRRVLYFLSVLFSLLTYFLARKEQKYRYLAMTCKSL